MNKVKRIVEKILPRKVSIELKSLKKRIRGFSYLKVTSFFSSALFLSNSYYFFFSREFSREHRAVLAGKKRYYSALRNNIASSYLLRRNIHRLEKGLIMPKRRKVFALDFIGETVDEYVRIVTFNNSAFSKNELKWATDVLTEYFDAVDVASKKILIENEEKFKNFKSSQYSGPSKQAYTPFLRDFENKQVSFDDFFSLCNKRRSVRFFEREAPEKKVVDLAIDASLQSPSACNRQPFSYRIFDDPVKVREVASIPAGTKTFYKEIPGIIVVVGHLDAYYRERDRHAIYVDGALAVMSLILAFESLNISSCVINWGDEEPAESKIQKLLNLEKSDRVLMLVAYGYPDKNVKVPYSSKREVETVRKYNEY